MYILFVYPLKDYENLSYNTLFLISKLWLSVAVTHQIRPYRDIETKENMRNWRQQAIASGKRISNMN